MLVPVGIVGYLPSRVTQLAFFNNELNTFEWTYILFIFHKKKMMTNIL